MADPVLTWAEAPQDRIKYIQVFVFPYPDNFAELAGNDFIGPNTGITIPVDSTSFDCSVLQYKDGTKVHVSIAAVYYDQPVINVQGPIAGILNQEITNRSEIGLATVDYIAGGLKGVDNLLATLNLPGFGILDGLVNANPDRVNWESLNGTTIHIPNVTVNSSYDLLIGGILVNGDPYDVFFHKYTNEPLLFNFAITAGPFVLGGSPPASIGFSNTLGAYLNLDTGTTGPIPNDEGNEATGGTVIITIPTN